MNILLVGAGQIGSRHLQALKKVRMPLDITVIDPSKQSLSTAKQRYEEAPKGKFVHNLNYVQEIPNNQNIDLAIVATTSDIRAGVIKSILKKNKVRYFILEKTLFDKKSDYRRIDKLLAKLKIKAWINCPTRTRPIYKRVANELSGKKIVFRVTGSNWGLATNAIHCLDYVSYLSKNSDFSIDTRYLDKEIIKSKRKGFLELNGMLIADFKNGSRCELVSYNFGNAPLLNEIFSTDARYIIKGPEKGRAWVSRSKKSWKWEEVAFKTPLISETTTVFAEDILRKGACALPTYKESAKIHLALLEPLREFVNKNSQKKYDHYPFT